MSAQIASAPYPRMYLRVVITLTPRELVPRDALEGSEAFRSRTADLGVYV